MKSGSKAVAYRLDVDAHGADDSEDEFRKISSFRSATGHAELEINWSNRTIQSDSNALHLERTQMAKVAIRKDELDLVVEIATRAAKRTNSIVVIAEDRLDLVEDQNSQKQAPPKDKPVAMFG
jgi:hypothetical protein